MTEYFLRNGRFDPAIKKGLIIGFLLALAIGFLLVFLSGCQSHSIYSEEREWSTSAAPKYEDCDDACRADGAIGGYWTPMEEGDTTRTCICRFRRETGGAT